jgi:hypothetical protein
MKILARWNLFVLAVLTATIVYAPIALADDINPDADVPDISTLADSEPENQVLEIPQECDQDMGALPCNRSLDNSSSISDTYADPPNDGESDLANSPNVGADYDYANQNYTDEGLAEGTTAVPMGIYAPGYPALSPAPMMVSPNLVGPGSYQQWASGPGTFQQSVPGPGYISPQPPGYRPYGFASGSGRPAFGSFGGGHLGRR